MLGDVLATHDVSETLGGIALLSINHLDRDDALVAMRRRNARLDAEIQAIESYPPHSTGIGVDVAIDRRLSILNSDRNWFTDGLHLAADVLTGKSEL